MKKKPMPAQSRLPTPAGYCQALIYHLNRLEKKHKFAGLMLLFPDGPIMTIHSRQPDRHQYLKSRVLEGGLPLATMVIDIDHDTISVTTVTALPGLPCDLTPALQAGLTEAARTVTKSVLEGWGVVVVGPIPVQVIAPGGMVQ
jgi:hypothetical protein